MEKNGNIPPKDTIVSDNSDSQLPAASAGAGAGSTTRSQEKGNNHNASSHKSPKKRRKVNHACVYCRRSHMTCDLERPCTRCVKRNIGHLCRDEPRDSESKKARSVHGASVIDESDTRSEVTRSTSKQTMAALRALEQGSQYGGSASLRQGNPLQQLVQPAQGVQAGAINSNLSQFAGLNDAWLSNPFHDMHNYHPNYTGIVPEVSHEFNLLNDFLHRSLLDDGALSPEGSNHLFKNNSGSNNNNSNNNNNNNNNNNSGSQGTSSEMGPGSYFSGAATGGSNNLLSPSAMPPGAMGPPGLTDQSSSSLARAAAASQHEKARDYYLQAADPSGAESPDVRMERLLEAKHRAGLLQPFNYSKGYSRLLKYLDDHVAPSSKQKVLRQLDRFRPKFREKVEKLTDYHLVIIEVWFEQTLMEYDRVFASMAIPACCWRRTGEIFRGNTEMADLLGIPVDHLRDGKVSLHEILTEESVVRYWEEFGTIAFDPEHDSLLTACALKSPDEKNKTVTNCCFSFMIRRDDYTLPSLIVGNFLPHDP